MTFGRVRVVDHAAGAVRGLHAHGVIHEVAFKLARGPPALFQPPDDAEAVARVVDLHDADVVLRRALDVLKELAAAGGDEVLARQVRRAHAHLNVGAVIGEVRLREGGLVLRHAVGQVASVALVPALLPAQLAGVDVFPHAVDVKDAVHPVFLPFRRALRARPVRTPRPRPATPRARARPRGGRPRPTQRPRDSPCTPRPAPEAA